LTVGNLPEEDDFDRWVSGQADSIAAANAASQQYSGSSYYAPGFADLYTYGAFSNCGAYGFGWRPFGAGFGWSPFTSGQWIFDPASGGYAWLSYQPWGWAPYHYGGWLFDASCGGWFYSPPLLYGYAGYGVGTGKIYPKRVHPPLPVYHAVTGVFVRNGGKTAIVPMHPLDEKGKTPMNLGHGVFSLEGSKTMSAQPIPVEHGQKWEALKSPPREGLGNGLVATGPPARVSRSVVEGKSGIRTVALDNNSTIAYDPLERRFVNSNARETSSSLNGRQDRVELGTTGAAISAPTAARTPTTPPATHGASSPPARNNVPPAAPRYSGGNSGRSSGWGGASASSSGSSSGRSSSSASTSTTSSHPASGKPH